MNERNKRAIGISLCFGSVYLGFVLYTFLPTAINRLTGQTLFKYGNTTNGFVNQMNSSVYTGASLLGLSDFLLGLLLLALIIGGIILLYGVLHKAQGFF